MIILATIDYITDIIDNHKNETELHKNYDENEVKQTSWLFSFFHSKPIIKYKHSKYHIHIITEFKEAISNPEYTRNFNDFNFVSNFVKICYDSRYFNELNYFGIAGVLALCNQSDGGGYYTPGNSLDICLLFDKIEQFLKNYDCYDCIYIKENRLFDRLYDVFKYSHQKLQNVLIT